MIANLPKLKLWQQIFAAMLLGVIAGIGFGQDIAVIKPLGDLFINMIKMIVIPLVFFSIATAITGNQDGSSLGRIGIKSLIIYVFSTAIAIVIGISLAKLFDPAAGLNGLNLFAEMEKTTTAKEPVSFLEALVAMVPTNPINAMAEGNVLQVIVFAIFVGAAVNVAGKKVKIIGSNIAEAAEVFYSMTAIIMKFAPYGVFALIAWVVGTQDPQILRSLLKLVIVVIAACLIHAATIYTLFVAGLARLNPLPFYKKIIDAQIFAFCTSSSSATLPLTMKVAEEKLGVSQKIANFVLPLGSTVNMDGTAIYIGITTVFVAALAGVDLSLTDYVVVVFTATIASVGAAGIPGVALIMMSMVFVAVGLPVEAIGIIAGVDRLLDMFRTSVNVTGDLAISVVIDQSEGTLDKKLYNS